jgi:hypothetical protein
MKTRRPIPATSKPEAAEDESKPWLTHPWVADDDYFSRKEWLELPSEVFERFMALRKVEASERTANELEKLRRSLEQATASTFKVKLVRPPKEWFTLDEVAKECGITVKTLKGYLDPSQKQNIRGGKIHGQLAREIKRRANDERKKKVAHLKQGGFNRNLKKNR